MPQPRKSDKVKLVKGTFQPCRERQAVAAAGSVGQPPEYLNTGERMCWNEFASIAPAGTLGAADAVWLATACRLENEYRTKGFDMPASKIGLLLKCLGKLGMNPTDRTNVPPPEPETSNPYDDF